MDPPPLATRPPADIDRNLAQSGSSTPNGAGQVSRVRWPALGQAPHGRIGAEGDSLQRLLEGRRSTAPFDARGHELLDGGCDFARPAQPLDPSPPVGL